MRVALINPKLPKGSPIWIPIGLLSIAAFIREKGIKVKILDNNLVKDTETEIKKTLLKFKPDIIGITGMTVQLKDALLCANIIKDISNNIRLVYGGVHFTFLPEDGLKYGDIVVIGEGEETFCDICSGKPPPEIKGIVYKDGNRIVRTRQRDFIADLDIIPFPAYNLVNINKYDDCLTSGEKSITILTGRGCPFDCVFCASPQIYLRKVRYHSIKYVIEHIDFFKKRYGLKNLRIMDDTFTINKNRIIAFCEEVSKLPYKLNFACLTHVNTADYELFQRMKAVGFSIITFGVESGSEAVLKYINKKIAKDGVRKAVSWAKKAGLDTEILFMVGNIGETKDALDESIIFAKELDSRYTYFQYAVPFPGSRFYEIASQYGEVLTDDTERYDHQEPVFAPFGLDKETMERKRQEALEIQRYKNILIAKARKNTSGLRHVLKRLWKKRL